MEEPLRVGATRHASANAAGFFARAGNRHWHEGRVRRDGAVRGGRRDEASSLAEAGSKRVTQQEGDARVRVPFRPG